MTMPTITQYRPAFFDGFENEVNEFNSVEELLRIPWVKQFSNGEVKNFHRYSVSMPNKKWGESKCHLMAEYDNGAVWWVVGKMDENEIIEELPKWEAPK